MERAQHRMSRSRTRIEGNRHIKEERVTGKFTSDFYSDNRATAKEAMDMFEMGKSSSKRVTGTPMKKLLAEEMSKEMEAKRRSPSVVARLMGLDGLPSPQHGHRQQTRLSGNHHQISGSIGVQRDSHLFDGRSSGGCSAEHQEFKDVYEDLEASHVVNHRYSSRWSSDPKLKERELSHVQQKFSDPRRLSTNERLHALTKFNDTLGAIDSNKELLLQFLQQPDSLFAKHVNDLQLDPSRIPCNHIAILKPSNSVKYEGNAKAWKSERICVCKHDVKSHRKRKDGLLLHSLSHHTAQKSLQSSNSQSQEKAVKHNLPTRIVVLKPGKTNNVMSSALSPDSTHVYLPDCRKHMTYPTLETVEAKLLEKSDPSNVVGLSRPKCREAREVAKKITMQMRENFGVFDRGPINFTNSGVRGYAGDESSYDACDSDSDSASDVVTVASRKSFGWNSQVRSQSSTSTESLVNREAKKRLSERWKMSHRYQDEEICGKSSTLGEMLAIPVKERKLEHLDAARSWDGASDGFPGTDVTAGWEGPLGISSRDGWKDGCMKRSSRARSLPPSYGGKSQKASEQHDALDDGRFLVNRETMNWGSRKALKGNLSKKEGSSAKESRSSGKRHCLYREKFVGNSDFSPKAIFSQTEIEINSEKVEHSEEQLLASSMPMSSLEILPDLSSSTIKSGDSSACDQEHSTIQEASTILFEEGSASSPCPCPETESSESSKEADRPSPVSVLEVALKEDASSGPECLERVSAELQELRMQLQLLKMESEVDTDVSMLVTNDEDVLSQTEDKHMLNAESWEEFYIVDVLLESGFEEPNPDMFVATWQYPEFPLDASVFDNLEKKYSDGATGLRSVRRLLFDRINSALVEIFQQHMDTCPWVKPATRRVDSIWQKHGLKDALNNLLAGLASNASLATPERIWQKHGLKDALNNLLAAQASNASLATPERMLDWEMEWLGCRDGIDMIGKEIEKLLTNELIMEVVTM